MSSQNDKPWWVWSSAGAQNDKSAAPPISLLALAETLAAISLFLLIAIKLDTWVHVFAASFLAPFLLLRTQISEERGVKAFRLIERLRQHLPDFKNLPNVKSKSPTALMVLPIVIAVTQALYYVSVFIWALLVKFFVTVVTVVQHPVQSFEAIPNNWYKVAFNIDSRTRLQLVPGSDWFPLAPLTIFSSEDQKPDILSARFFISSFFISIASLLGLSYNFQVLIANAVTHGQWSSVNFLFALLTCVMFIGTLIASGTVIAVHLVAYSYRLSLKSTFLVWSPLVYVASSTFTKALTLRQRLERVCTSAPSKIARLYAVLTAVLVVCKLVILFYLESVEDFLGHYAWATQLDLFVQHDTLPMWQLTALINALLAWGMYLFADTFLFRFKSHMKFDKEHVDTWLRIMTFLRGVLSVYSIVCVGYIVMQLAYDLSWPEIRVIFFPW